MSFMLGLCAVADTTDDLKFFADNFKMRLVVEPKLRAPFKLFIDKSKDLREISFNEYALNFMYVSVCASVVGANDNESVMIRECSNVNYISCGVESSYGNALKNQFLVYGFVEKLLEVIKDNILNTNPKKVKAIEISASLKNFVKIRGLDPNKLTVYSDPVVLKGEVLEQWLALAKSYVPEKEKLAL